MSTDLIALARTVVGPGPDVERTLKSTPREVPGAWRAGGLAGMAIGLVGLVLGLVSGDADTTHRTLGILLVCIVYFFGVSQGGVMFAVAQTVTLGRWGRPFKRIAESFAFFLPIVYLLWIAFLLAGGTDIYDWKHETMHGHKAIWLAPGFFVARQIVLMGLLTVLSLVFVRNSLRPDLGAAQEEHGIQPPSWLAWITGGWKGRAVEVEEAYQRNIRLGPVMIVSYAIIFTIFAVDAVMSLAPHWYANMFPAWIFVSSFWLSLNWVVIISVTTRHWLAIDHLTKATNYHDIGKLIFALCVFWAYTFFAQLLPIWYGNMPEETSYLLLRLYAEPWAPLSRVVGAMCFVIPFSVLLSRGIKKIPSSLIGISGVIALGLFLERFMLVMPEVWLKESIPFGFVEICVLVGFVSAFFTVVTTVLSKIPPVVFTDPFMNPNPSDVHIHPLSADGHAAHH
ncbi:MAG: hypothetical protein ACOZNI_18440 [Myxococcota bacterium]